MAVNFVPLSRYMENCKCFNNEKPVIAYWCCSLFYHDGLLDTSSSLCFCRNMTKKKWSQKKKNWKRWQKKKRIEGREMREKTKEGPGKMKHESNIISKIKNIYWNNVLIQYQINALYNKFTLLCYCYISVLVILFWCSNLICSKSLLWLNMSLKHIPYLDFVFSYFILYWDVVSINTTRILTSFVWYKIKKI